MTIDLEAIRVRDASVANDAYTLMTQPMRDRRALLQYMDELREAYEVVRLQLTERGDNYLRECVALRKDAERYRWLRADTRRIAHIHVEANVRHARGVDVPRATDAAIDAAMGESHDK